MNDAGTVAAWITGAGAVIATSVKYMDGRVDAAIKRVNKDRIEPMEEQLRELLSRIEHLEDRMTDAHGHVLKARDLTIKGGHDQITVHLDDALEALTSK